MAPPTRYELEMSFVTPCFLKGVSDEQPELRAPSVRGMLRWWLRAVQGGRLGLLEVRKLESSLFGESAGDKGRQGKVLLRVAGAVRLGKVGTTAWTSSSDGEADGKRFVASAYLGYGPFEWKKEAHANVANRGHLAPGSPFQISLLCRLDLQEDERRSLALAVWGLTRLGGLGSRSRRGYGSVEIRDSGDLLATLGPAFAAAVPGEELKALLAGDSRGEPEFSAISSRSVLFRGPDQDSWQNALGWLGRAWKECRIRVRDRFGERHAPSDRGYLGLPLIIDRQDHPIGNADRRASPILVRVSRAGDKFVPLVLGLPSLFHHEERARQRDFNRVFDEAVGFFAKRDGVRQIWK